MFCIATAIGCITQMTYINRLGTHLICCPNPVTSVWKREIQKIYPNLASYTLTYLGIDIERNVVFQQLISLYGNCIVIIPYSQVGNFYQFAKKLSMRFDSLVLDESHMIKNSNSQRYGWCAKLASLCVRITELSGTYSYTESLLTHTFSNTISR